MEFNVVNQAGIFYCQGSRNKEQFPVPFWKTGQLMGYYLVSVYNNTLH